MANKYDVYFDASVCKARGSVGRGEDCESFEGFSSKRLSQGAGKCSGYQAPYCTQILSDYGADVIKIEGPQRGMSTDRPYIPGNVTNGTKDDTRYWRVSSEDGAWNDGVGPISNYFTAVNRNKRSLSLNLKHTKGKEIFFQLVKEVDVVVENLRTGAMERLGLGYDALRKVNNCIILASTSGYGASGPYASRAGYDMIAGAEAGLLHLTGERGGKPVRLGLGLTDICTGLYMHGAIVSALYARERTGEGQKLDGSLFETQAALLTNVALTWLNLGIEAERWGTQHPSVVPYDAFKTKDLYFVCGATNDQQFAKLATILGRPDLPNDPDYASNPQRVTNRKKLYGILGDLFAQRTTDEWEQAFDGSGMPYAYAPINTMQKVFDHPQTKARDMVMQMPFEAAKKGFVNVLGGPAVKFSKSPASIRSRPPLHGEQTGEVLGELGIFASELDDLKAGGVVLFNGEIGSMYWNTISQTCAPRN